MPYATSEDTKKRLIKTMSRLIQTQGYFATGVSQILTESDVPKGSLYYHFPDGKSELAALAVSASREWMNQNLRKMVEATAHPITTITAFCDYYIQQMEKSHYEKGCPIATIALEVAATVDPIQQECQQAFADITQIFADQLHEHGLPSQQADQLAIMMLASIEGALIMSRAERAVRPLVVVRDVLGSMLRAALPPANG